MARATDVVRRTWHLLMEGGGPEPIEEGVDEQPPTGIVSVDALELVLRVGELLLAGGEATERVNESMLSLAVAYELPQCEVSVTFTVISVSVHPVGAAPVTGARAIRRRQPAYWRLVLIHRLVREATIGALTVEEANARLTEIKRIRPPYPPWLIVAGFGSVAASASVLAGGGPLVATTAFVAAVLADRTSAAMARRGIAEFFQLTMAAALATTAAALVIAAGAPARASTIVAGAIVALLPGRPLVASIQDGITGDLVSAGARLLEVFLIVAAIVSGVGLAVYAAVRLGVRIEVSHLPTASPALRLVPIVAAAGVATAFAVSLAVPRVVLPATAVGGALIWIAYVVGRALELRPLLASACAAVLVGLLSHLLARRRQEPALPYIVPAIAPLLPGTALFRGMIELNTAGQAVTGVLTLISAVSIGLALGAGVNLGGELVRAFQRVGLGGFGRGARPAARRTRGY